MKTMRQIAILFAVLSSIILFTIFSVVQAGRAKALVAYLPALFGAVAGPSPTATPTATATPTDTVSPTATATVTATATPTDTVSPTPTATVTATVTPTDTPGSRHFSNCAFNTGNNATIAILANVTINGGIVLELDDEIAIFNPSASICAGTALWNGENIAVTAWGDDTLTEELDGLLDGEEMRFRIWDRSAGKEISVIEVTYSLGNGIYQTDSLHQVNSLTVTIP